MYINFKRIADFIGATLILLLALPLFFLISLLIYIDDPGSVIFTQNRIGRNKSIFRIYKFRTMKLGTPNLSTEEMRASGINVITRFGAVLRRTSLDELPQLVNIILGEMSFIGPRPALPSQVRVIELRERFGVNAILPGITGYAQATGRDDLSDEEKVRQDTFYLNHQSIQLDLKIMMMTVTSVLRGTGNK